MGTENPGYGTIDFDFGHHMATIDPADDGPIWMVNLMKYKEVATYADGVDGKVVTGREADNRYAPTQILNELGAEIVFVADVEATLLGDGTEWDRIAIVRYPTRRSFIEMTNRPDFQDKHEHKEAGMAFTINIGCVPATLPDLSIFDDAPDWSDVPHPPTDEDGEIVVLHVIRYADDGGRDAMEQYQEAAAEVGIPLGVRIGAWFDVEGTIIGDGRSWDQVRFNRFPSRAAFTALATHPDRLEAQAAHREPAMTDTYTMVLRPTRDHLDVH